MNKDIFEEVSRIGVIPVIAISSVDHALPLADALLEGGLTIIEVTFRTEAAVDVLACLRDKRPELLIGAGTLLTGETVQQALDAGARFGLAPGYDPTVVRAAEKASLPFAPGVMTPSDIALAVNAGCRLMKFFPAIPAGGLQMLKNITAPFSHLGLKFIPTGGVKQDSMAEWLTHPDIAAVGGTWIASRDDMDNGDWKGITLKAKTAVKKVKEIRG
ncbi:MAG: bifunctional 4-hydroxy-2-oxoglutarate aldolase/2-dehydro-3-deoxy-phosphogluconate aldolase [Proteobacteria bacterium]|nr:bifunctional 4-hydroxy-2-oxoglutarate aldolase/2-dehydro-3-deoxy-phosphogluconate aldolase [Pseudomonadota bacterium]